MHGMSALMALAASEGGHVAVSTDPGGFLGLLVHWAWLIPVVPLAVVGLIVLIGKRLPFRGWGPWCSSGAGWSTACRS